MKHINFILAAAGSVISACDQSTHQQTRSLGHGSSYRESGAGPWSHLLTAYGLGLMLVVSTAWSAQIPVQERTIDGNFSSASSVFAADMDGDGDLDVLGAGFSDDEITWWENSGDGTGWSEHLVDGDFNAAISVFAADMDGDGDMDVLGAAIADDDITWWENTGACDGPAGECSSWIEHEVDPSFNGAHSVFAADVDGDGDMDVLGAAQFANRIAWWENTGACTGIGGSCSNWTERGVGGLGQARAVFARDMDGDGDIDVLGASSGSDQLIWWENTLENGTSWSPHRVTNTFDGARSVYAADVDGDGDVDVIGAAELDDAVSWWENTGPCDGTGGACTGWIEHNLADDFDGAYSVYATDLDGDGDTDILAACFQDDDMSWWENTSGDGSTWTERVIDTFFWNARSIYAADVDGDGDSDVLGAALSANDITWWENESIHRSAFFPEKQIVNGALAAVHAVHAVDVDGDSDLDLVSALPNSGEIVLHQNAGGGSLWTEVGVGSSADGVQAVHGADVDGDGDMDVLSAAATADNILWWRNTDGDGLAWEQKIVDSSFDGAHDVFATDVDGDGDMDVLGAARLADTVSWWENTAADGSTWAEHVVSTSFGEAVSVYATDMDGDGDMDALGAAFAGNDLTWWENTAGDGSAWTEHLVDGDFAGAFEIYAADMDGDGDTDVLGVAQSAEQVAWWENTGICAGAGGSCTNWIKHGVASLAGIRSAYAADLDQDGDTDVLAVGSSSGAVHWWENLDGSGQTWQEHVVDSSFDGANAIIAADLDGNGQVDLIATGSGAGSGADEVAWWPGLGGQFSLPALDTAPARVSAGESATALVFDVVHQGRPGDPDMELHRLELELQDASGNVLTEAQIGALLAELAIYLDDGSGAYDPELDTLVQSSTSFALNGEVLRIPFQDGDPDVRVSVGSFKTYFVVPTFESTASVADPDDLRLIHRAEASRGEDAAHDLPLLREFWPDTSTQTIEVNDLLVAAPDALMLLEDVGTVAGNVLDGSSGGLDLDEESDALTALLVSGPSDGSLVGGLAADGAFHYQPSPDYHGVDSFSYHASDGFGFSNTTTVTLTIAPVNDPPSFDIQNHLFVDQDSGAVSFPGFASDLSTGPANEAGQELTFETIGNTAPGLFSAGPALSSDGTLTFIPAPGIAGLAVITVRLKDDGGTDNGGVDTSGSRDFSIEVLDPVTEIFLDGFESGDSSAWTISDP